MLPGGTPGSESRLENERSTPDASADERWPHRNAEKKVDQILAYF